MLKEKETLWGLSIFDLRTTCKKYKLYSFIILMFDILFMFGLVFVMYKRNLDYVSYLIVMLLVTFVFWLLYNKILNPIKYASYKFFNKHSNQQVVEKTYDIDKDKMYSILFCISTKRFRKYKTLEGYKEFILNSCCNDYTYANRIMKIISKYENPKGSLKILVLQTGKKEYLIDFVNEDDDVNVDEEEVKDAED